MTISSETRVVAIIGHPVKHSISPLMHNAAFRHLGLDYVYVAFTVSPGVLGEAVSGVRALGIAGLNVTVPHKQHIMQYLDTIDPEASFMGAVNTVVNRDGKLSGHNTDGRGFMKSLDEGGIDVSGKRVLVLGAGGASRAVSYCLGEKAGRLYIYNRTAERARRLVEDLSINFNNVEHLPDLGDIGGMDVVVNATSLGLKDSDPPPCDTSMLREGQVAVDLIYRETSFLREASAKGLRTLDGTGMLLWQGVLAFELWTGKTPPVEVFREALA